MRMKSYHVDLRKLYERFGRSNFKTYSLYNMFGKFNGGLATDFRNGNHNARAILSLFINKRLIVPVNITHSQSMYIKEKEEVKKKKSAFSFSGLGSADVDLNWVWKISGKGLYELHGVYDDIGIDLTEEDYMFVAKTELISG
jgi:hypothetical protein